MSTFADTELRAPPRAVFVSREEVPLIGDGILIYGETEERSQIPDVWRNHFGDAGLLLIKELDTFGQISVDQVPGVVFSLRESSEIRSWLGSLSPAVVFLDITGLSHHVWLPLLRFLVELGKEVRCLYAEPGQYYAHPNPRPGEFYQLSEKFRGFLPVPTFARLRSRGQVLSILVPLLGFEGARFRRLVEIVEPAERDIYPIVGIPGFEIEYPFHTYEGNADVLRSTRSWQRIDYADAACPFSLFHRLEMLRSQWPRHLLQLALIGTKPHALGAALFALKDQEVELLHDHPIRKTNRTSGSGRCHVYDVSTFLRYV